jgi:hypothetical protein
MLQECMTFFISGLAQNIQNLARMLKIFNQFVRIEKDNMYAKVVFQTCMVSMYKFEGFTAANIENKIIPMQ